MLHVGLIGFGYWGPNLARNFNSNPDCTLFAIADSDKERRARAKIAFPQARIADADMLIADEQVDAVAIATPVPTHFELARAALEAGKHVWVEKPMTETPEEARQLVDLARERGRILMVDHTFLFTGAVQTMKEQIDAGALGKLFYYDSARVNLGIYQRDVNVVWDLAPHDFSILQYLLSNLPVAVSAHGADHAGTGLEDMAYVTLFYADGFLAHLHLNWLAPVKLRRIMVGGDKKMLVWDDLSLDEKIKIYDKGMDVTSAEGRYQVLAEARIGAMTAPVVPHVEALAKEVAYFVECIEKNETPVNDGKAGLAVMKLLEATNRSLKSRGEAIEIDWSDLDR